MRSKLPRTLLLVAVLSVGPAHGEAEPQASEDLAARMARVETTLFPAVHVKGVTRPSRIADRMAQQRLPGLSVAVIDNGTLAWARGYGVTEAGGGAAVSAETLFQAVSLAQPVTAIAALVLVERGMLALDEDVNLRLRSWKVLDQDLTRERKVTLRGLLSHTSGLNVPGLRGYASGEQIPSLLQVLRGEAPANSAPIRVEIEPGSRWRFSSGGYVVLQQLLSDVTGRPFPDLMRDLVLDPLGMTSSTFEQPLPAALAGRAAAAHRANGSILDGKWHLYPEMAAAGLWSTPSDLARLALEVHHAYGGERGRLVSPSMARQMLTPQLNNYGLGFRTAGEDRAFHFTFGGSNEGFKSQLVLFPETGQGAVVMTNGDAGARLIDAVQRSIAGEYDWPALRTTERQPAAIDPSLPAEYAGEYLLRPGVSWMVTQESGALFVARPGTPRTPVYAETPTRFFIEDDAGTWYIFQRNGKGKVSELVGEFAGGQKLTARRVDAIPRLADLSWLLGTWKHETATSTTFESWRQLSDRTLEGESWRVSKATQQRVFGEALLLAEMAGEIFYLPKVPENAYPVAFRATVADTGEAVFENPSHDFPQKITYRRNGDGSVDAFVEGLGSGQPRRLHLHYVKVPTPQP